MDVFRLIYWQYIQWMSWIMFRELLANSFNHYVMYTLALLLEGVHWYRWWLLRIIQREPYWKFEFNLAQCVAQDSSTMFVTWCAIVGIMLGSKRRMDGVGVLTRMLGNLINRSHICASLVPVVDMCPVVGSLYQHWNAICTRSKRRCCYCCWLNSCNRAFVQEETFLTIFFRTVVCYWYLLQLTESGLTL